MKITPHRLRALRTRVKCRRDKAKRKSKPQTNTNIAPWKPRFLKVIDIEQVRRTPRGQLENLLTHCERISYKDWSEAKKRRARRSKKSDTWYLVLNPPEPFLAVTPERIAGYLHCTK